MKILSIYNRKILLFCLVLFCGAAAAIGLFCSSTEPRKTEGSFFEIAGFAMEDVTKVSICYDDVAQDLLEVDQQRLLNSLNSTQGSQITFDHEYPYHVSEYQIRLHVADKVYEFPFAWFSGFDYIISGSGESARYTSLMQYTDRRVDVQIDSAWFTFQQADNTFWNEDISYMAYYAAQPKRKGDLASACSSGGYRFVKDTPDYSDPKYHIYSSDLIVIAKHVKRDYVPIDPSLPKNAYNYLLSEDFFEVVEILKGDWDPSQLLSVKQLGPELDHDGTVRDLDAQNVMQGGLDSHYSYIDEDGGTYLLFLENTYSYTGERSVATHYTSYSLARIYNDTAYACVNHEDHAFLAMPLSELRELCAQCILYENNVDSNASDPVLSTEADVDSFVTSAIQACLLDAGSENYVFSPANLYLQLGLLAESTDGDTRDQILNVLGSSDIEAICSRVSSIYNANQITDSWEHTSTLSNSLWIDDTYSLKDDAIRALAARYKTSAYRGDADSVSFKHFFRDWPVEQTQYYIQEELLLDAEMASTLLGTMYLNIAWEEPFSLLAYSEETFSAPTSEIICEFMHQTTELDYYRGEHFSAVSKTLASDGAVKFILPDADTSIDLLLRDDEVLDLMVSDLCSDSRIQYEKSTVNLSLPKFTLFCNTNLAEPLKSMGITDIFNDQKADFSPISYDETSFSLSQLLHVNRVVINPDGCVRDYEEWDPWTAPEFTKGEGIDFVVDRPFLFVVTGSDGMPLLAGVIYEPSYINRISVS